MWLSIKDKIWKWRAVLAAAGGVAGMTIAIAYTGAFQLLEWAMFDRFMRLRSVEDIDRRLVVVTIDESDIRHVGKWPVSGEILAQLIANIQAQHPRAIGLDIYRDLPVEPGHDRLEEVFQHTPTLIGVEKVVGDEVDPPPILEARDRVSIADIVIDPDGKVRRALLSTRSEEDGQIKLSLGVRLALEYLEAEGLELEETNTQKRYLKIGKAVFKPFLGNDGPYVRATSGGYQILLNYRGTEEQFLTVPMSAVLAGNIPDNIFSDRLVLIGAIAPSLNDMFPTPYSSHLTTSPKRLAGVFVHANIASQIVSGAIEGRPFIHTVPDPIEWLWILFWALVSAASRWILLQTTLLKTPIAPRWTAFGICAIVVGGILVGCSYALFLNSWWLPIVSPLVAIVFSAAISTSYYFREFQRENLRRLNEFLEAMPAGVAVFDRNGNPYYANLRVRQLLWGRADFLDAPLDDIFSTIRFYISGTRKLCSPDRQPGKKALQGRIAKTENLELHRGDRIIPLEIWETPIIDRHGKIAYALVTFQDTSDRVAAEAEREAFTNRLHELNRELDRALELEQEMTDAACRFVPNQFLHFLGCESIVDVRIGRAVQQEMSVLFADIRDFTRMSEQMTPEDNFKFINAYLSRMEPAIREHDGFIDKYIGDAIMALFGGSADDAVRAAISMLQRLTDYNTTRQRPGRPPISVGIGINTGSLMLGTVGGQDRMDSTAIGDAVNLAARIEELTKSYDVSLLISNYTFLSLRETSDYSIRVVDRVKVKGKEESISVFEVFDADSPELRSQKLETRTIFEQAILTYTLAQFEAAAHLFEKCLQIAPGDTVARVYRDRCRQHLS